MAQDKPDHMLEVEPVTPANDELARALEWVGISAAIGMVITALVIAL